MRFEIEIDEKKLEELKKFFSEQDGEDFSSIDTIKELFFVEDRHGELFDLRDDVSITKSETLTKQDEANQWFIDHLDMEQKSNILSQYEDWLED